VILKIKITPLQCIRLLVSAVSRTTVLLVQDNLPYTLFFPYREHLVCSSSVISTVATRCQCLAMSDGKISSSVIPADPQAFSEHRRDLSISKGTLVSLDMST
jgi:hypothetical protein